MKKPQIISLLAVLAISSSITTPAQADPPPWAAAHGYRAKTEHVERAEREYRYVYYPSRQVYFAPATNTWFWLNGGNWQVGVTLPTQYRAYVTNGNGVPIALNASRPYVQHVYVEEHYGKPWREKHKRRGRDDHDRHHHHDDHRRDRHDDHRH